MKLRFKVASFLAAMFLAFVSPKPCSAAAVTDPPNDFLPSYTGPHNGDLDVVAANVTLAESNLDFTATFNNVIPITPGVACVFGINRGKGTAKFGNIGEGGVLFDSTFVISQDDVGVVHDRYLEQQANGFGLRA